MLHQKQLQKEYSQRINRAIDYIQENLTSDLSLERVAQEACFSPFHFHRIFSTLVGETVNQFIARLRIEYAANRLLRQTNYSIAEIASMSGFNSPTSFSRAFKKYYGISATEMQKKTQSQYSKICKTESKNGKVVYTIQDYLCNIQKLIQKMNMKTNVVIKELPEVKVAYIRHIGEYKGLRKAFENLFQWGGKSGLMPHMQKVIAVYHDDPNITEEDKVRSSVCMSFDCDFKPEGEVGEMVVKGGKYAVGRFEVKMEEFTDAWNFMCAWTIEHGYDCADGDYHEIYYNNHEEHPEKKFIVDICIPVA